KNPSHLWLLHHLFLDSINHDCANFQGNWNYHPILGEGHNMLPVQMEAEGQLLHGFYGDECKGVPIDLIKQYYGAEGPRLKHNPHQRGAGSSQDKEMEDAANEQVESNAYPDAIPVPQKNCPFDEAELIVFKHQMKTLQKSGFTPEGYFILPDEWDEEYLPYKNIPVGRQGNFLHIILTHSIWLPCAEDWAQGHYLLDAITNT
ncbi:hypothetical protein P691DRAFT_684576, partial [Macrolepiota fuliginosa MF-IS2]